MKQTIFQLCFATSPNVLGKHGQFMQNVWFAQKTFRFKKRKKCVEIFPFPLIFRKNVYRKTGCCIGLSCSSQVSSHSTLQPLLIRDIVLTTGVSSSPPPICLPWHPLTGSLPHASHTSQSPQSAHLGISISNQRRSTPDTILQQTEAVAGPAWLGHRNSSPGTDSHTVLHTSLPRVRGYWSSFTQ